MGNVSETLEEVKRRVDVRSLLIDSGHCQAGIREGTVIPCPFHQDSNPSLSVHSDHVYCFSPGCRFSTHGGDALDVWMALHGGEWLDGLKALAERAGVPFEEDPYARQRVKQRRDLETVYSEIAQLGRHWLQHDKTGADARRWLSSRGITMQAAEQCWLGWIPRGGNLLRALTGDRCKRHGVGYGGWSTQQVLEAGVVVETGDRMWNILGGCVIFPHRVGGRVAYLTGRAIADKKHRKLKKASKISPVSPSVWWPAGRAARKGDTVLLVEGEVDAVTAQQSIPDGVVVAGLCGASMKPGKIAKAIVDGARVVVALDRDDAGRKATNDLAFRMPERVNTVPDEEHFCADGWDLNDALLAGSAAGGDLDEAIEILRDGLASMVTASRPWPDLSMERIKDALKDEGIPKALELTKEVMVPAMMRMDPDMQDVYVNELSTRLKLRVSSFRRMIERGASDKSGLRVVQPDETPEPQQFRGLRVPHGYFVDSSERLFRVFFRQTPEGRDVEASRVLVTPTTPWVTRVFEDDEKGSMTWELSWVDVRTKKVRTMVAARSSVCISTKCVELSEYGLPVSSENAREISGWLVRLEAENSDRIPATISTGRMGWHDRVFLWGTEALGEAEGEANAPQYHPPDEGESQILNALTASGTFEEWFKVVCPMLQRYPMLSVAVAAAVTAPVLRIVNCDNFVLEMASTASSIGKTSAMRVAESVWGKPGHPGLERSFLATQTSIERYLSGLGDLPGFFDDTQVVDRNLDPAKVAYMIADGFGKGRGSLKGQRASRCWHTVGIITGENRLEDSGPFEGLAARIMGLWTPIWQHGDKKVNLEDIAKTMDKIAEHHGHAGPLVIEWLTLEGIAAVQTQYQFWRDWVADLWRGHPTMMRRARHAAAMLTAAEVAQQAWPWPESGPSLTDQVSAAIDTIAGSVHERDVPTDAMQHTMDWISGNLANFYGSGETAEGCTTELKVREYYGVDQGQGRFALFSRALAQVLEKRNYSYRATCQEWRARGWIDAPLKGAFTRVVRVRGGPVSRCIVIDTAKFNESQQAAARRLADRAESVTHP